MARIDKKGALHGSVSNIVYRTYRGQQIAQLKPKKFVQTRATQEAGLEFGLCSSTACAIRTAFASVYRVHDGKMVNRLLTRVRKSISSSTARERGERDIHDAETSYLKGFQFNANSSLENVVTARPEAQLSEENQIRVYLPAIKEADIKGLKADKYIIRLVAISFNFKEDVYTYNCYREIEIDSSHPWQGGEIRMDEGIQDGRLVLLAMTIHAYKKDYYDGFICINSKEWSPAELIGAWHANGVLNEPEVKMGRVDGVLTLLTGYKSHDYFTKIAELRKKSPKPEAKPKKTELKSVSKWRSTDFNLPEGNVKIKK